MDLADSDYALKLKYGYKLTTLQIYYYLPDYTNIINEFIYQFLDINPKFPRTHKFLSYWKDNIETPIKEINIAQEGDIYPKSFSYAECLISFGLKY